MGKFTAIETYDRFTKLRDNNNLDNRSLNFILDTRQLYTHGILINSATYGTKTAGAVELTIAGSKETLSLSNHTHSNYLEKNSNIDIGSYKIVSGDKDLLYYSSGIAYLGNTSSSIVLQGTSGSIKKGDTLYTLLDTSNFSVLGTSATGLSLPNNAAKITWGNSNFQIDYVKRLNSTLAFNDLYGYSNAGVTLTSSKYYAFTTLRNDGSDTARWAQVRIDIASKSMQFRTSADTSTWYSVVTSIPSNAVNIAGMVAAPTSTDAYKVWQTDDSGNPAWRSVTAPDTVPTLSWRTESTIGSIGGVTFKIKMPSNPNTDKKVTQTITTSSNTDIRPILLSYTSHASSSSGFGTVTNTTYAAKNVYIKPSTGDLTSTGTIKGSSIVNSSSSNSYVLLGGGGTKPLSDFTSDVISATITSVSLSTNWNDVDALNSRLTNGSYIVQITYASCIYTGTFSYVQGGTVDDEIVLHCSGTIDSVGGVDRGRLYAKIGTTSGTTYLKLASSLNESNANLSIKYRKLI